MKKQRLGHWRVYMRLFVGMLLVSILVFGVVFQSAWATTQTDSGVVTIAAIVPGPPPSVASTITSPLNGATFTSNPITIKGSCPADGLIIKIIDNGRMVGSAVCNGGNYSLIIDLFRGQNTLIAREFDSLNQQGPASAAVTVSLNQPSSLITPSQSQLVISLSGQYSGYTGCLPGQQLSLPLTFSGGTPPYAVHVDWGDGSNSLASLKNSAEPLIANHSYGQAGNYQVMITASDANGQQALLSIVVVINGQPASLPTKVGRAAQSIWRLQWYYPGGGLVLLGIGYLFGKWSGRSKK